VFRSKKERESDSLIEKTGYGLGRSPVLINQLYIQKNLINKETKKLFTSSLFNDKYFIRINEKLDWKILPDKMKIGDMDCQKAAVTYGGRNWEAWFTQSVPLQEGPYIFHGLPGLIVKISDDRSDYNFSLIQTRNSNKNNMFAVRNGKEITWDAFKKLQLDYYSDPYAEIKTRNIKFKVADSNGKEIPMDLKSLGSNVQQQIKKNNNPIELSEAIKYP
jgi:GLPGLI family protein